MTLIIDAVSKRFGRFPALSGVSLEVANGEFLALLGPSGSGKTTLLRVLAGLETPESGSVFLDDEDFLALPARERRVGLVFQHYALFRHMTVERNIAFGLEVRRRSERPDRGAISERVAHLLALTQIEGLSHRYPAQLSGGQRQRVAVARALAVEPRLLLLDEPFGALDTRVREELRGELRRIHDATAVTTILVTHDQDEAMALADRVVLMNAGRVEQVGTPLELDREPATPFAFEFLGETNRLACEVVAGVARFEGFSSPALGSGQRDGAGLALFRPHDTVLNQAEGAPGLPVRIVGVSGRGALGRVECQALSGARMTAEMPRPEAEGFSVGQRVRLTARRVVVDASAKVEPRRDEGDYRRARRAG